MSQLTEHTRLVVGSDSVSAELFQLLKTRRPDIRRVLDVCHPVEEIAQALLRADANLWGFAPETYDDLRPIGDWAGRTAEFELADQIIVASRFTAEGIVAQGISPDIVTRIPYGIPISDDSETLNSRPRDVLRLLFVGALSERKGVSLLLKAMTELELAGRPVTLDIVGKEAVDYLLPRDLPSNVTYLGSVSAAELDLLMLSCHVSILPSMCEGFGRTILEALARGMVVVATERTGARDVLELSDDAPVFIIPVNQRDQLANFILLNYDRLIDDNSARAFATARQFSSDVYADRLNSALS